VLLSNGLESLHGLAWLHIYNQVLRLLRDLMRACYAEARIHLHHVLLVSLVEVHVSSNGLIHFCLTTSGLRHDNILVSLLLLQDRGRRVKEGTTVLTTKEREGVADTACLRSKDRHFYNYTL
jgi:hypothetical protein